MSEDPEYKVGYGKPPLHTRFQKNKSGNPSGRKAGSKSLKTQVREELAKSIVVTEKGRRKRIRKMDALAQVIVNEGLNKNRSAWREIAKALGDDVLYDSEVDNKKENLYPTPMDYVSNLSESDRVELVYSLAAMLCVKELYQATDTNYRELFSDKVMEHVKKIKDYMDATYG